MYPDTSELRNSIVVSNGGPSLSRVSRFRNMIGSIRTTIASSSKQQYHSHACKLYPTIQITHPLGTIDEGKEEESYELDVLTEEKIKSCIVLLSSSDIDQNRLGLQRLMTWTSKMAIFKAEAEKKEYSSSVSHVIIYGGGAMVECLRRLLVKILVVHNVEKDDTKDEQDDDRDESSAEVTFSERSMQVTKKCRSLHCQALKVLTNALEQIILTTTDYEDSDDDGDDDGDLSPINFKDEVWQKIVRTLVQNVERSELSDVTGYSLKILRLLHTFEPVLMTPLLRYTLLPHLAYLQENSRMSRFPAIETETSRLLKRVEIL